MRSANSWPWQSDLKWICRRWNHCACWMRANVEFVAAKKGMSAALAISEHASSNLKGYSLDRPGRAAEALRNRKVQSSGSYRLQLTF